VPAATVTDQPTGTPGTLQGAKNPATDSALAEQADTNDPTAATGPTNDGIADAGSPRRAHQRRTHQGRATTTDSPTRTRHDGLADADSPRRTHQGRIAQRRTHHAGLTNAGLANAGLAHAGLTNAGLTKTDSLRRADHAERPVCCPPALGRPRTLASEDPGGPWVPGIPTPSGWVPGFSESPSRGGSCPHCQNRRRGGSYPHCQKRRRGGSCPHCQKRRRGGCTRTARIAVGGGWYPTAESPSGGWYRHSETPSGRLVRTARIAVGGWCPHCQNGGRRRGGVGQCAGAANEEGQDSSHRMTAPQRTAARHTRRRPGARPGFWWGVGVSLWFWARFAVSLSVSAPPRWRLRPHWPTRPAPPAHSEQCGHHHPDGDAGSAVTKPP